MINRFSLFVFSMIFFIGFKADAALPRDVRLKVMKQVVKLRVMVRRNGQFVEAGHGSGSIISANGLILTNNHVVQNTKTGQLFDAIAIAPNVGFDKAPPAVCIAWPHRAIRHPKLDLAIIKCEADMQGRPLKKPINWSNVVQLGDSQTLIPGDDIHIVGFPGVGGATITFTSGKVSGFLADNRVGTGRVWIKTDALISGGVSGGAAFDDQGKLIGVPTAYRRGSRGHTAIGLVRVIHKAKALIAMAQKKPWSKQPRVAQVMPDQAPRRFNYQKPPKDARPLPKHVPDLRPLGKAPNSPGRNPSDIYPNAPKGEVDGRDTRDRAQSSKGKRRFSLVRGRIVDSNTLQPIRGAMIAVFKPGVNVYRVKKYNLRRSVQALGKADQRGFFTTRGYVVQGRKHAVMIVANGYKPLRANNAVEVLVGGPPHFDMGLIKLRPKTKRYRPRREPLPEYSEEIAP